MYRARIQSQEKGTASILALSVFSLYKQTGKNKGSHCRCLKVLAWSVQSADKCLGRGWEGHGLPDLADDRLGHGLTWYHGLIKS